MLSAEFPVLLPNAERLVRALTRHGYSLGLPAARRICAAVALDRKPAHLLARLLEQQNIPLKHMAARDILDATRDMSSLGQSWKVADWQTDANYEPFTVAEFSAARSAVAELCRRVAETMRWREKELTYVVLSTTTTSLRVAIVGWGCREFLLTAVPPVAGHSELEPQVSSAFRYAGERLRRYFEEHCCGWLDGVAAVRAGVLASDARLRLKADGVTLAEGFESEVLDHVVRRSYAGADVEMSVVGRGVLARPLEPTVVDSLASRYRSAIQRLSLRPSALALGSLDAQLNSGTEVGVNVAAVRSAMARRKVSDDEVAAALQLGLDGWQALMTAAVTSAGVLASLAHTLEVSTAELYRFADRRFSRTVVSSHYDLQRVVDRFENTCFAAEFSQQALQDQSLDLGWLKPVNKARDFTGADGLLNQATQSRFDALAPAGYALTHHSGLQYVADLPDGYSRLCKVMFVAVERASLVKIQPSDIPGHAGQPYIDWSSGSMSAYLGLQNQVRHCQWKHDSQSDNDLTDEDVSVLFAVLANCPSAKAGGEQSFAIFPFFEALGWNRRRDAERAERALQRLATVPVSLPGLTFQAGRSQPLISRYDCSGDVEAGLNFWSVEWAVDLSVIVPNAERLERAVEYRRNVAPTRYLELWVHYLLTIFGTVGPITKSELRRLSGEDGGAAWDFSSRLRSALENLQHEGFVDAIEVPGEQLLLRVPDFTKQIPKRAVVGRRWAAQAE